MVGKRKMQFFFVRIMIEDGLTLYVERWVHALRSINKIHFNTINTIINRLI